MDKKAQVVVITLWVVLVFTILAVNVGHRVSLGLRISRYERDGLKSAWLAKTGLNLAIQELNSGNANIVTLNDSWANTEDLFAKNNLDKTQDQINKINITDEERKININAADSEVLEALFKQSGMSQVEAEALRHDIFMWRATEPIDEDTANYYLFDLGYACKKAHFSNVEEIALVKGVKEIDPEVLEKLKSLLTVFGSGKINLNTASPEVIDILINAATAKLVKSGVRINTSLDALREMIIQARLANNFSQTNLVSALNLSGAADTDLINLCNKLRSLVDLRSQNFLIRSTVQVSGSGLNRGIACVYNRGSNRIVFWHEN
jgi:type II secretory pathway component PulK